MNDGSIFEVVYIDASGHTRKEAILIAPDKATAIGEFADIVSPHTVELWQESKLVASRRPNGPCVAVTDWSPQKLLLKTLTPFLRSSKKVGAAA